MRELPISAMITLSGFDGRYPEKYFIPRAEIGTLPLLFLPLIRLGRD